MSLQVAVQMDPIETVNIETDTTFFMMLEAQVRGHALWVSTPERLAFEDGNLALAASLLERAVTNEVPPSVWFDLGLVRQDLRDHQGAVAAYRKAIELKSDYAEAALNLGVVLQESGDLDGAMRAYAQAYRLRPQSFGTIAMALTSAPHGRLWLDEAALRQALAG